MTDMATEGNAVAQSDIALYVGDLDVNVTEEELNRLFSRIGDVTSVKICKDQTTMQSLVYGYVNYSNPEHAAKALEDLNFTPLNGNPIRIAYSNPDASLRRSGIGNIFVKNLDREIDHKALHALFSPFGNIVSSKVATDSSGCSRGYGFVQYNSEDAAKNAIEQLNGVLLRGKELHVAPFVSKQERDASVDKTKFTNVFVKNLSESTTEEDLKTTFGEFGSITSLAVMRDEDGNSKCFGFVNFESAEDAGKSVEVLNGRIFDGKEWYVGRAQTKYERKRELRLLHEQRAKEALERSLAQNNVYIKNLDDMIEDKKLKELFSPFGTITSCKVMTDPKGINKGSGFVAFSNSQEASRAICEMNGRMVGRKPLYVAIAEKKEVRTARLQALFNMLQNMTATAVAPPLPMYPPAGPGAGQQFFYGHPPPVLRPMPGYGYQQPFGPGVRPSGLIPSVLLPMLQPAPPGLQRAGRRPGPAVVQQSRPPILPIHQQILQMGNAYRPPPGYGTYNVFTQDSTAGMLSLSQGSSPLPVHDRRMRSPIPVATLASTLANASPMEQRRILGEHLYPLVEELERDMAAEVTGMLLEMDQTEVLNLLESPECLRDKVAEAMELLGNTPERQPSSPSELLASLLLNE